VLINQIVSHYKILEKLGEGGMGVVYKAEDTKLKRTVALKFLSSHILKNKEEKIRFLNEAQTAAAINHPHVTTIYEIDEHEDQTYISMEYVEGQTLKEKIAHGPLPITEIINMSLQICEGLQQAHEKDIIHRDIKSDNIMVTQKGQAKIMDFGLAKLRVGANGYSPSITKIGTTMGTANYMSPEQAMGKEIDHRTDIWSLGVVMYEMVTGQLPFKGDYEQAIIYAILNEKPKPLIELRPETPIQLWQLIERSLAKDPDKRIQDVDTLLQGLKTIKDNTASEKGIHIRNSARKTSRLLLPTMIIAVILAILIGGYFLFKGKPPPPESSVKTTKKSTWTNSIAVLPFMDLSPNKDQEYFCDGMADAIIDRLTQIKNMKIAALTSVIRYKKTDKDIKTIGKELGVNHIVEGTVQKEKKRIRVRVQLIKVKTGFHLWSKSFDKTLESVFDVQDEISIGVARALEFNLFPENLNVLKSSQPKSLEAYEYYLKGLFYINSRYLIFGQEKDFETALMMFKRALEIDSEYGLAYSGLSYSYYSHSIYRGNISDRFQAIEYARKAFKMNPEHPHIIIQMGIVHIYNRDYDSLYKSCKKALLLNPNSFLVNFVVGYMYDTIGLKIQSIKFMSIAIALDPNFAHAYYWRGNNSLYYLGDMDQAKADLTKAIELKKNFISARWDLFNLYIIQKEYNRAKRILSELETITGEDLSSKNALILASKGQRQEALKILKEPNIRNLYAYCLLDMKDEAISLITGYIKNNTTSLYLNLLNNPFFQNLGKDPRFKEIIADEKIKYDKLLKKFGDL
jgi:serine/threonine protein kinase/tetratricopeptide (TPR) repeat protein